MEFPRQVMDFPIKQDTIAADFQFPRQTPLSLPLLHSGYLHKQTSE